MERGTRVKTHPFHSREDARRWLLAQITDEM
jgi:hypothetical protein